MNAEQTSGDDRDLAELRDTATKLSIPDADAMTADQLRSAIEQRHQGRDPRQAENNAGDNQQG